MSAAFFLNGTIQNTPQGFFLRCQSDEFDLPIAMTGDKMPLLQSIPKEVFYWRVIPKTDSAGILSGVKAWGMARADAAELERWQFTGTIRQVSSRNGLIAIATLVDTPRPLDLLLTLHTNTPDQFAVDQQWQLTVERQGDRLVVTQSTCLSPLQPSIEAVAKFAEPAASTALAATTVDLEAIACRCAAARSAVAVAQSALRSHSGLDGWQLSSPKEREDVAWRMKVWEFEAQIGSRSARVKVSSKGDRTLVYGLNSTPSLHDRDSGATASDTVPGALRDRLTVIPLGAAQSIGASCFRILIGPYEVVLDAGTRPKGKNPLPAFEQLERPDLLLITHAHQDHIGALPVFHARFNEVPMYSTVGTRELAHIMLRDGLNVQSRNEDSEPLFSEVELARSLFRLQTISFNQDFEPLPGLQVRFIPAGHIVGAACIYLRYGTRKLLYTGDFHVANSRTTEGLKLSDLPKADVLITESTYGNCAHPARRAQERELVEAVRAIVESGGNVLIPAFALGRAQEILLLLRQDAAFGKLNVPIFVDGLVRPVTDCFQSHLDLLPTALQRFAQQQNLFFPDRLPQVVSIERADDRPLAISKPSVIIASSGMLTGGASVYYAQILLERENAALFISGYTDEESPGRRVQALQTGSTIDLDGRTITVRAKVERFNLSAHADRVGLGQVIDAIDPQHLILIHGSPDAIESLSEVSGLRRKRFVYRPKVGDAINATIAPAWVGDRQAAHIQARQSKEFEAIVTAEFNGGWIQIPPEVVEQGDRWDAFAATGTLTAKWVGKSLVLTPAALPTRREAIDTDERCCANCQFYCDRRCRCEDSVLVDRTVDELGCCPEFERKVVNDS